MHFFERLFEALTTYVIHCEKDECLRQWHTIGTRVQKLNVRIHLSKNRTKNDFA